jgi:hypothetical protein
MALKFKNKKDFGLKLRGDDLRAENTALIKGGSVVVGGRWVPFGDLRFDVRALVSGYMSTASRRVFNNRGDIMYVLVCLDGNGTLQVVPSIALNRKNYGDIKTFPSLSGLLPLMLVKLRHDGSEDLSSMLPITEQDIQSYKGYGNFTYGGVRGPTGLPGVTGYQGVTGWSGIDGYMGVTGLRGHTGISGKWVQGVTGPQGSQGASIPAYQSSFTTYVQDVVDQSIDGWQDTVDDGEDEVQDTV